MARRSAARRLAIEILYQADLLGRTPLDVLEERRALGEKVPAFTEDLVRGVADAVPDLDGVIGQHSEDWSVERMAPVVRAVLRVAVFEVLRRPEVPPAAAIDEAVAAAKELASEEAARFVNGILGGVVRDRVTNA